MYALQRPLFYGLVTWIVEALVVLIVLRFLPGRARRPTLRYWTDMLLVNAFTNPLTIFALQCGVPFAAAETVVVLVEWPLYRAVLGLKWWEGFVVSAIANGVTIALSYAI